MLHSLVCGIGAEKHKEQVASCICWARMVHSVGECVYFGPGDLLVEEINFRFRVEEIKTEKRDARMV